MRITSIAIAFSLAGGVAAAEDFDFITLRPIGPGVDQIRIDRPNPTRRSVDYPQITFQPNDTVTIAAGGCVQSGGRGSTWHRYVDPSGGDSDKLYHGLITIPFATGVLERIQKYNNTQVHVAATAPPGNLHLQLGFEDDNYSDNGYYSHDDGPNDQCKLPEGGPAWVLLTVVHNSGGGTTGGSARLDWDLNVSNFDDNGIPLNPNWKANINGHLPSADNCNWPWNDKKSNLPDCASPGQITGKDEHYTCEVRYFRSDHGLGGHANWTAATYTGTALWDLHSNSVYDDDDYAVNIRTPGAAGATPGRTDGVHVEFSSDETIDPLSDDFKLPWWKKFHDAVDNGDPHAFLDGKDIIVTGLLGLDFIHTIGAESHPAWTFAWHPNSDFADDTWVFFVRNWGNEGYCSGDQHYISFVGNQYTFRFPWPAGATSGVATDGTTFLTNSNAGAATVSFIPNQAVLLTFHDLPDPTAQGLVAGELHIRWTGTPARRGSGLGSVGGRLRQPGRVTGATTATSRQPSELTESFIVDSVAQLTPAQRAVYLANAPKKPQAAHKPVKPVRWQTGPPPVKVQPNQHPQLRSAPDTAEAARKDAQIEALRKAGGKVPPKPR